MELTFVLVVGVISIVAVAAFSQRLGLAAPLSLVIVGIGLSFVPGVPHPEIPPELVLAGVLPPLLYSAAVSMPVVDFRRNLKPITGLAVLLVVVTTLAGGWLFHWLLPGIGWPAAFALGAVISPTDAVAATSVGRRLGLPNRLLTVLEGEGLVNDASALVLLRTATGAVAASVSLWGVVGEFAYAVALAIVVGLIVGVVNVRIRALLKDAVLNTAVSFVIPFVAYLPAEEMGASGVLAVVVAGVVTGHLSPRHLRAEDRIAESTNWRTLAFLLECATFLFLGLSLSNLIAEAAGHDLGLRHTVIVAVAATVLVIVIRVVFTAPLVGVMRRDLRRATAAVPRLEHIRSKLDEWDGDERLTRRRRFIERRFTRASADVRFHLNETLGWRGGVVLAWSGMRGAITVAAAQTLPEATPMRPQLILIAFLVAVTTLLLQGLSLPAVIRLVDVPGDDPQRLHEDYRRLMDDLTGAAADLLNDPGLRDPDGGEYDPRAVDQVRADSRVPEPGADPVETPEIDAGIKRQYAQLRLRVLTAEAERLLAARSIGDYSSEALSHAQSVLDVDMVRLRRLNDVLADND